MSQCYNSPRPCKLDVPSIVAIGQAVATKKGYDPELSLRSFIEKNDGQLIEKSDKIPPELGYAGSCIIIDENGSYTIHTRELSESRGRRFDIAHEYGHYILHYLYNLKTSKENILPLIAARNPVEEGSPEEIVENEANIFAISFLMNKEKFQEKYESFDFSISRMAFYFNVSRATVYSFGKHLGLTEWKA